MPGWSTYTELRDWLDRYTSPDGTIQGDPATIAGEAAAAGLVAKDAAYHEQLGDEAVVPAGPRYRATFRPQAWVRDNAIEVDPEGETSWDCSAFIAEIVAEPGTGGAEWLLRTLEHGDRDDILRTDPNAPAWVAGWRGPFDTELVLVEGGE